MTEKTVESMFGANAGTVWEALKEKGPCTIADLARTTSLGREEVHGALGWLGRENKISAKMGEGLRGRRATVFSLQP